VYISSEYALRAFCRAKVWLPNVLSEAVISLFP
jgi:hypothetical protein